MKSRSYLYNLKNPLILNSCFLILACAGPGNRPQSGTGGEEACLQMANAFCARVTQCLISPDCQDDLRDIGFTCENYTGDPDEAQRCAQAFSEFECDYIKFGKLPVSCPSDAPHKEYMKPDSGGTGGNTGGGTGGNTGGGTGGNSPSSCGDNNACGAQAPSGCWCDNGCAEYGDCCTDVCSACGACSGGGVGGGSGNLSCTEWLECINTCEDPNQAELCIEDCGSYLKSDSVPIAQALYNCVFDAVNFVCYDLCADPAAQECVDCVGNYCSPEMQACLNDV